MNVDMQSDRFERHAQVWVKCMSGVIGENQMLEMRNIARVIYND